MKELSQIDARKALQGELDRLKNKYADQYELSFRGSDAILNVCSAIETMQREGSAVYGFGYDVAPKDKNGMVYVDVSDAIMQGGRTHPFFTAIKHVDRLRFSASSTESIRIMFNVNDLWKRL